MSKLQDKLNEKLDDLAERKSEIQSTEIIETPGSYLAVTQQAVAIITENLKNKPISRQSIDTIKSPSGGTLVFTIPSITGDDIEKELTGVILDYTTPRAYWETTDPVEGTSPTCYSSDGSLSSEGKACRNCVFNTFGSKEGETNAKACKESVELYLLRPDTIMPVIVRIPVSSKLLFQRYLTRLVSHMKPLCGVVTKITLEKATNKTGQAYAKFNFEAVETLSSEETQGMRAYGNHIMEVLKDDDEIGTTTLEKVG